MLFKSGGSGDTSAQSKVDSLNRANNSLVALIKATDDSANKVIAQKEALNVTLELKLRSITEKYVAIRHSHPTRDTVVKDSIVYRGNECCEKLQVMVPQVSNLQGEVRLYKNLVIKKNNQNSKLQKQYERAMVINSDQLDQVKKLEKKRKWNKVWAVCSSSVALGLVAAILVIK